MCNNHACNGHACNSRACNSHAWWYTRRVCSTPQEIVVHANTLREYLKISRGATRLHACKNEVIIERYRSLICTYVRNYSYKDIRIFQQNNGDLSLKLQLEFLNLIDKVILLMSASDVIMLANKCAKLMASDTENIPLFSTNFIKKLRNNPYPFIFKMYLFPFITWFDHSILQVLVKSSRSKEALQLLNQFDSCIDYDQHITPYTIPEYSQLIIPSKGNDSEFTLIVTKHFKNHNEITLQDLLDMKKALMLNWELTIHAIHLVAMHSELNCFYWMIPRKIQPIVKVKLSEDQQMLLDRGIIMVALLPDNYLSDEDYQPNEECKLYFINFNMEDATEVSIIITYLSQYYLIM